MGDASLDDFFAKKDKTRKNKKNKLTPEELAKQLEEQGRSGSGRRKDKSRSGENSSDPLSSLKILEQNDEEWKDFEDEKEKDYRGLKIQSLSLTREKEEEVREQLKLQENGGDKGKEDPWNKRAASPVPQQQSTKEETCKTSPEDDVQSEKKEEKGDEDPGKNESSGGPSRYIPPHARYSGSSGDSRNNNSNSSFNPQPMAALLRKPKSSAPQINDEQDFPSLG